MFRGFTVIAINIKPVPASRPRVTRWATFYSKPYQEYKDYLKCNIPNLVSIQDGVLCLKAIFYVPFPTKWDNEDFLNLYQDRFKNETLKGVRKHHKEELEGELAVTYSDVDNLVKALLDGLNGYSFKDDMQVAKMILEKRYSISPRTEFTVYSIKEQ